MKKNIRERLLKKRDSIKLVQKEKKESAIRKRLFASVDFKKAKSILFYASFRSEVDTTKCIRHALKLKKIIALPCVDRRKRELKLYRLNNISELKPGYMGIQEPIVAKSREMSLKSINVVIVPGAGFDKSGNRIGYGFGYYDRLLSRSEKPVPAIALAFEEQIVPKVPNEIHDVKIDKIITDKRVIDCQNR